MLSSWRSIKEELGLGEGGCSRAEHAGAGTQVRCSSLAQQPCPACRNSEQGGKPFQGLRKVKDLLSALSGTPQSCCGAHSAGMFLLSQGGVLLSQSFLPGEL